MLPIRIAGTGSVLPGRRVTTEEIAERAFPGRDPAVLIERTGIRSRHLYDPDADDVARVAARTVALALRDAGVEPDALRRLILVNSVGFDDPLPSTANKVAMHLGVRRTCDCMDLSNACTGFVTGFDVAARGVATGIGPTVVVATELLSRFMDPGAPRPYAVLGDASAAAVLTPALGAGGVLGWASGNDGFLGDRVTLARGGAVIEFAQANPTISDEVVRTMGEVVRDALAMAGVSAGDVSWFLLHQPNGVMFERCAEALGVGPDRLVPVVDAIGSVGAASVPFSLDRLRRTHGLRPGEIVVLGAVGSGLSWAALVLRVD